MLLQIVEAPVERLGGVGDFLDVLRGSRQVVGHGVEMVDRRHALALLMRLHHLPHGVHPRLGGVLDRQFKRGPQLLLIGRELQASLHAGELGVEHGLAIFRHLMHPLGA